jgi:hypothetical protein
MSVDAKIMTVVGAIKQSLQTASGPGSSVNSHPNPFFLNVTGEINLKHAAELIIERADRQGVRGGAQAEDRESVILSNRAGSCVPARFLV